MLFNKIPALILGISLSLATIPVNAASLTVPGVMAKMGTISGTIKGLLKENDGLVAVNNTLLKKNKLWEGQLRRIAPKEKLFIKKAEAHVVKEKKYTRIINAHKARCPRIVDTQAQVDKCRGEKPYLRRITKEYYDEKRVLKAEQKALIAERKSYVDLIVANNRTITKNYNRHLAIVKSVDRYNKNLELYRKHLIFLCTKADTDRDGEALHYCQSMNWDGAKKNLPTLDEIMKGTKFFNR